MEPDEAAELAEDAYRSAEIRRSLVRLLMSAYEGAITRSEEYGPWSIGRWGIPHDRRALIDGKLFELSGTFPDAQPVLLNNRRKSYTFLAAQFGRVLLFAARTPSPRKLPRVADLRVRLAQIAQVAKSRQVSFFEEFAIGYDPPSGAPLLTILAHGPSRGMPSELGWARILVPDHRYQSVVHSIDLLRRGDLGDIIGVPSTPIAPTPGTGTIDMPPVRPRLRRRDDKQETGS